jgi:hypothetical protein
MEWCIPLQKLEVSKVQIGSLYVQNVKGTKDKKPLAPLAYIDGQSVFQSLHILLPHLTVESYDPLNGRLEILIDSPQAVAKLQALQTSLLNTVSQQQVAWFGSNTLRKEDIQRFFQPMIEEKRLHLYCPILHPPQEGADGKRFLQNVTKVWSENIWYDGLRPGLLKAGQRVRIALQLQGISLHIQNDAWTGRARLQHRILGILVQGIKKQDKEKEKEKEKEKQEELLIE